MLSAKSGSFSTRLPYTIVLHFANYSFMNQVAIESSS